MSTLTRVHVHGAFGRMGAAAVEALHGATDLECVAQTGRGDDLAAALAASTPDVLVEFTVPDAGAAHLMAAVEAGVPVVSGTTGIADGDLERIDARASERELGVLVAPNFALGVLLMQRFAAEAARWFDDVEIIERHHEKKLDAPSGTARATAIDVAVARRGRPAAAGGRGEDVDGVPVHSLRLPGSLAHQEVLFGGLGETLTIRHDTLDRRAFMPGVLLAVRRIGEFRGVVRSLAPFLEETP